MERELHCFILWQNARYKENDIIRDISGRFEIVKSYEIAWEKDCFSENLSKLYGKNLRKSRKKEKLVGSGEFLLCIVFDKKPIYENNKNVNIVNAKMEYREKTGGGHLIHASDTPEEANENVLLILNKDIDSIV